MILMKLIVSIVKVLCRILKMVFKIIKLSVHLCGFIKPKEYNRAEHFLGYRFKKHNEYLRQG